MHYLSEGQFTLHKLKTVVGNCLQLELYCVIGDVFGCMIRLKHIKCPYERDGASQPGYPSWPGLCEILLLLLCPISFGVYMGTELASLSGLARLSRLSVIALFTGIHCCK